VANLRVSNSYYIDTTGTVASKGLRLLYVILSATSANAILTLKDSGVAGTLFDLRVATSGESRVFDFSRNPPAFPNGMEISAITNGHATAIIQLGGAE
jgi:hypothetical protein